MNKEIFSKMAKLSTNYIKKAAKDPEKFDSMCSGVSYSIAYAHLSAIWQSAFTEILLTDYLDDKLELSDEQKARIDELYIQKLESEEKRLKELLMKIQ